MDFQKRMIPKEILKLSSATVQYEQFLFSNGRAIGKKRANFCLYLAFGQSHQSYRNRYYHQTGNQAVMLNKE
ncbi:hypothetical protein [Neobacillus niacini]|uniref:hypothetical protein n=1 Tax=Neobacillus niacini TaxID=86668 RepID=UPI003983524A